MCRYTDRETENRPCIPEVYAQLCLHTQLEHFHLNQHILVQYRYHSMSHTQEVAKNGPVYLIRTHFSLIFQRFHYTVTFIQRNGKDMG